ncbi:MAG: IS30 family transposase [Cellvibrionaceae bacterium]|jgi:IS30 family transposase
MSALLLSTALSSKIRPLVASFTITFTIKPYKKSTGSSDARGQIIGRIPIDERPAIVDKKVREVNWEADPVISTCHKGVLVT